jgi:hypothetical protein
MCNFSVTRLEALTSFSSRIGSIFHFLCLCHQRKKVEGTTSKRNRSRTMNRCRTNDELPILVIPTLHASMHASAPVTVKCYCSNTSDKPHARV